MSRLITPPVCARLLWVLILLAASTAWPDVIRLRDGRVIRGKILGRSGHRVSIKTDDGKIVVVNARDVFDPRKDYEKQRKLLKPGDHQGWLSLARYCVKYGLDREGKAALDRATRKCKDVETLLAAAKLCGEIKDAYRARLAYEQAVAVEPDCEAARKALGHLLWRSQWYRAAGDAAEAARNARDATPRQLHELAVACWAGRAPADALELLGRASAEADLDLLALIAKAYGEWKQPTRAQSIYAKIIEIDPKHADSRRALGHLEHDGGWYSSAAELYAALAKACPAIAQKRYELAEWCRTQGLEAEARFELKRVIEIDPDHRQARTALGHVQFQGRWCEQLRLVSIGWHKELESQGPDGGLRILLPPKEPDWFLEIRCRVHKSLRSVGRGALVASDFAAYLQPPATVSAFSFVEKQAAGFRFLKSVTPRPNDEWVDLRLMFIASANSQVKGLGYKKVKVWR